MQTKNIIQATANVIKITTLKKGDLFKRFDTDYNKTLYGVVLDVLNDGENTFLEVLEYEKSWREIKAEFNVYSGKKDISLFPTDIKEVKEFFEEAVKDLEKSIEDKKKELYKETEGLKKAQEFITGELTKQLSTIEFTEISQTEYDTQKKIKEEKLKQLSEA